MTAFLLLPVSLFKVFEDLLKLVILFPFLLLFLLEEQLLPLFWLPHILFAVLPSVESQALADFSQNVFVLCYYSLHVDLFGRGHLLQVIFFVLLHVYPRHIFIDQQLRLLLRFRLVV